MAWGFYVCLSFGFGCFVSCPSWNNQCKQKNIVLMGLLLGDQNVTIKLSLTFIQGHHLTGRRSKSFEYISNR